MTKQTTMVRAAVRTGVVLLLALAGTGLATEAASAAVAATAVVSATQPAPGIVPGQTATSTVSVTDAGTRPTGRTKVAITLLATVAGQPTVTLTPAAGVSCKAKKATPLAPVCVVGKILPGGSATVAILTGAAPADTGGGLSTSVTIAGPTNSTTVSFLWAASLPTLTTSVALNPSAIQLGQYITGTLTVTNTGHGAAGYFLTYVALPSTADPETLVSQPAGTSCIPYYGELQCSMSDLAPGASSTVVWTFQPHSGPSAQVTATADVQNIVPQSTRAGDVATSNSVTVTGTGAQVSVTSSNVASTPQGSNFARTLTVTNTGDTPAFGTVVQDWSGWFNYLGTVSGGTCAQFTIGVGGKGGSHPVQAGTTCTIGTIPAGGSASVTFILEATSSQAVTTYTNKVVISTVTPGGTNTPGVSTIAVVVPITPVAPALLSGPAAPGGNVVVGDALTVGTGAWNGTPVIGFTYQWQDCTTSANPCTPIAGAIGSSYTVQANDVGSTIDCVVTATNGGGSASVTAPATVVAIAALAPSMVSPPTASAGGGSVIPYYASTGAWNGTPTITYTYQWYDCDSTGTSCTAISGATGSTYILTGADVGQYLEVRVTAANTGGSATAPSNLAGTAG